MTSHEQWGQKTSGFEVARTFADRIRGKKILITGVGPRGIGESTALCLASQAPALLILASRTKSKLDAVVSSIRNASPDVKTAIVILDLASQQQIRQAVQQIRQLTDSLDILINNAGLSVYSRQKTAEGIELQFGTNHVGPFLLTNLLLPLLVKSAKTSETPGSTRIVNVSSAGHRLSPVRFSDYNLEGKEVPDEEKPLPLSPMFSKETDDGYNGIVAYAQSKTANILHSLYLQKHLRKNGIAAYSLHPGSIETELGRDQDEELARAFVNVAKYWKTADEGASTTLVAALDPALDDINGLFLWDCQFLDAAPHANNPENATRLWHLSEKLVGESFTLDL